MRRRPLLLLWWWLLLLGQRCKSGLPLTALVGHDASKKIAGSMADGRRGGSGVSTTVAWKSSDAKV